MNEYRLLGNGLSPAGVLKNAVDQGARRYGPNTWTDKPPAITGTSPKPPAMVHMRPDPLMIVNTLKESVGL